MSIFDKPIQVRQTVTDLLTQTFQDPPSAVPHVDEPSFRMGSFSRDSRVHLAPHCLFKWINKVGEIKARYEEDLRGKFEAFRASGNLIAARDLIHLGGHGADIHEKWQEEAYLDLHSDPAAWLAAAEFQKRQGDYLSAKQHLDYALFIASHQMHSSRASIIDRDASRSSEFAVISFTANTKRDAQKIEEIEGKLKELKAEIGGLPDELGKRKAATAEISETTQDEALRNRAVRDHEKFKVVDEMVRGLAGVKFERIDLNELKTAAKLKLLGGALNGNQKLLTEGFQIGLQLERHAQLEARKSAVFEIWSNLNPRNSRFAFDMDVGALQGPVGPFEMPTPADVLESSPLLKLHRSLQRSGDPLASYMEEVAADFKNTARFQDDYDPTLHNRIFTDYRETTPKSLSALTSLNDRLENLYGDDRFQKVINKSVEGLKGDDSDGVPSIQEDLRSMSGLSGEITPEALENHRKRLISRGEKIVRFFEEKSKTLANQQGKYLLDNDHEGMGRITRTFDRLKEEDKTVKASFPYLQSLKNLGPIRDAGQMAAAEKTLRAAAGPVFAAAEVQMRSILQDQVAELGKKGAPLREKFAEIHPFDTQSLTRSEDGFDSCRESADALVDRHLKNYSEFSSHLEAENLKHAVDDSIASFKQARTQSHRADLAEQFFKPWSDVDFSSDERFEKMIQTFESARKLLDSNDPAQRERGANAARLLFGTSLGHRLQGKIRSSQWFDRYVVGPGVMLASAAASMTILRFAGPILGRYLSGTTLARTLFWTNAASFTVSNHLLNAEVRGIGMGNALKSMATHPGDTLEEVAITGAMMGFLKPFQGTVSGFADKTLGWNGMALKVLYPADLALELGGMHLFNRGLLPLYQNLKSHGLTTSLKNTWSAFKETDIAYDAGFIAFLHAGGIFSSSMLEPLNRSAETLGARFAGFDPKRLALDAHIAHLVGALGETEKLGEDAVPALNALEAAYRRQRIFLDKDIEALNQNAQALQNVVRFREAYTRSVLLRINREGARNRYGITFHASKDGLFNITSYAASKGTELIRDLKADPAVTDIKVHSNGLVVVTLMDPLGQPMTWRMVDRGGAVDILAMKREAARGGKPVTSGDQIPQNDNNESSVPWSISAKVAGATGY